MRDKIKLFLTAFFQVTFVAISQVAISKDVLWLLIIAGFMISYIWTMNVKRVAFGNHRDRLIYATGAMFGTITGYFLSNYIIKLWQ